MTYSSVVDEETQRRLYECEKRILASVPVIMDLAKKAGIEAEFDEDHLMATFRYPNPCGGTEKGPLSDERLNEIELRANAATEGPWKPKRLREAERMRREMYECGFELTFQSMSHGLVRLLGTKAADMNGDLEKVDAVGISEAHATERAYLKWKGREDG